MIPNLKITPEIAPEIIFKMREILREHPKLPATLALEIAKIEIAGEVVYPDV